MSYPPIPPNPTGWGYWTAGDVKSLITETLQSPYNDDRIAGLGPALDVGQSVLDDNPWNLSSKSRAVKLTMVESVGHSLPAAAVFTKDYLRLLWQNLSATEQGPWDIVEGAFVRIPDAANDVGSWLRDTGQSFADGANLDGSNAKVGIGLTALGAIGATALLAKVGLLKGAK